MWDLYLGLAIIYVLAAGLFMLAYAMSANAKPWHLDVAALITVLLLILYIQRLWDNVLLARMLPFSNLIVLGNWLPLGAGFLAGIVFRRIREHPWRRGIVTSCLILAGIYSGLHPLIGSVPECDDHWRNEVCMQTTMQTCSPACAATVLEKHGIDATEQEMAELCLTRKGTSWQGLYRGLKQKTRHTPLDVEVLDTDLAGLLAMSAGPIILSVGLPDNTTVDARFVDEWGWKPGVEHSVVLLGLDEHGDVRIADPAPGIGIETWSVDHLQLLWRGQAIRLRPRA